MKLDAAKDSVTDWTYIGVNPPSGDPQFPWMFHDDGPRVYVRISVNKFPGATCIRTTAPSLFLIFYEKETGKQFQFKRHYWVAVETIK